jgi:hypothetical protein
MALQVQTCSQVSKTLRRHLWLYQRRTANPQHALPLSSPQGTWVVAPNVYLRLYTNHMIILQCITVATSRRRQYQSSRRGGIWTLLQCRSEINPYY